MSQVMIDMEGRAGQYHVGLQTYPPPCHEALFPYYLYDPQSLPLPRALVLVLVLVLILPGLLQLSLLPVGGRSLPVHLRLCHQLRREGCDECRVSSQQHLGAQLRGEGDQEGSVVHLLGVGGVSGYRPPYLVPSRLVQDLLSNRLREVGECVVVVSDGLK